MLQPPIRNFFNKLQQGILHSLLIFFYLLLFGVITISLFLLIADDLQIQQTKQFVRQALRRNVDRRFIDDLYALIQDERSAIKPVTQNKTLKPIKPSPVIANKKYQYLHACNLKDRNRSFYTEKKVYQWKDSRDRIYISDQFPKDTDYHELKVRNYKSKKYFTLNIDSKNANLPALFSDRVRQEVNDIYDILINTIGVAKLRPIALNLKYYDKKSHFNHYKAQVASKLGAVGGFYIARLNEATIYTGKRKRRTFSITRHEATHAINYGAFGKTPIWLNEGMAEYFERLTWKHGTSRVVAPDRTFLKLLLKSKPPKLRDFFKLKGSQWYKDGKKHLHYAMAWSLFYFLMSNETDRRFLRYMLNDMGSRYCQVFSEINYINTHYQGGMQNFENNWRHWLTHEKEKHYL